MNAAGVGRNTGPERRKGVGDTISEKNSEKEKEKTQRKHSTEPIRRNLLPMHEDASKLPDPQVPGRTSHLPGKPRKEAIRSRRVKSISVHRSSPDWPGGST